MKKYLKIAKLLNCESIENLITKIKEFYKEVGQPYTIEQLGIKKEIYFSSLESLIEKSIQDSELAFNPVIMGEEDLKKIFTRAYEG